MTDVDGGEPPVGDELPDVADLDRLTLEHDARLRAALLTFDEALANLFQD